MKITQADRELFPFVRSYANDHYVRRFNSDDMEITNEISKSGDGGFWVNARVYVARDCAEWQRDREAADAYAENPPHGAKGHRLSRNCDQCVENGS